MANLQDFSLVRTHVDKIKNDNKLTKASHAFYFLILDLLFNLQYDEIEDCITDNDYLMMYGKPSGHDRGIDAIYIDSNSKNIEVHLFNFKYTENYANISKNFPSKEIDKIITFFNALLDKDNSLKMDVNPILYSKIEEIWNILTNQNPPKFIFHICSDYAEGFEKREGQRFEREIKNIVSSAEIRYLLIDGIVNHLTDKNRLKVNAKINAINKNYFEKSNGDIRALIMEIDVRDLLRIVLDDETIREEADISDYEKMKKYSILEDAFEDNVRIYLKQRSKINRNIKKTLLSDDNHRFFYFNNGITVTCSKFEYVKARSPTIKLENIQIVNGSQTIHALYDAFIEGSDTFEDVEILCRIYQTGNKDLVVNIAEYTNSQNPVKSRDIRAIDDTQIKLENELKIKGYFYERKKNQYPSEEKSKRIDAEKIGQVLMAFYNEMPVEALNKKSIIFADKYDDIFHDDVNADLVLLPYNLFLKIEEKKKEIKEKVISQEYPEDEIYIIYASYFILFLLKKLSEKNNLELSFKNIDKIWDFHEEAYGILNKVVEGARKADQYIDIKFFKSTKFKSKLESAL